MATVTGFTAERMKDIEDGTVTGGYINAAGELILQRYDGSEINAGQVKGEKGDPGPNPDEVYALKTEVPSIEETVVAAPVIFANDGYLYTPGTSGRHAVLMVAQFPMRILQATFVAGYAIPGTATNHYVMDFRRHRGVYDGGAGMASLCTIPLTAGVPRLQNFEIQPLNEANRNLDTNDLLILTASSVGTPTGNWPVSSVTIRYARRTP